jgi:hypothetical protein
MMFIFENKKYFLKIILLVCSVSRNIFYDVGLFSQFYLCLSFKSWVFLGVDLSFIYLNR